jgi:hypothetical protein
MKQSTFLKGLALLAICFFSFRSNAQITQVAAFSDDQNTDGAALVLTNPGGFAIGNVMIANIVQNDNDAGVALSNPTAPTGWTLIDGRSLGSNGNNDWWGAVFYKVVTASDVAAASFDFTPDSDADATSGGILVFRNVLASNIFDVTPGTINVANSDDLSATAITTVTANAAVIMLGMVGTERTFSGWNTTSPGTLTESFDLSTNNGADQGVGAAWALKASAGTTGPIGTAELSGNANTANGAILLALRPVNPIAPQATANLWSVSGTGDLRRYVMDPVTGVMLNGPTTVVTPLVSTAAVAKNQVTPFDADGCIYYLNRDESNNLNGVVTVYSVKPDGTSNASRGTIDMNGAGNDGDFSYVRMGFDAQGRGWILAGSDGSGNIYIASFQGNGVNPISNINTFGNTSLTVNAPGTAAEFQNGDLAITANGTLYALANVTDGQTYVYTLNSLTTPTTLSRRWTVQNNGGTFSGSVNGLAWTQSGSLHFSTSAGIYFIDQTTANTISGTVQASFVANSDGLGLTDLGSDKFPQQTTLPVSLGSFSVAKQGTNAMLNWTTVTEINTDHFEIERSFDGISFSKVGSKAAAGNSTDQLNYQFADPIGSLSASVIYYRIRTVDQDGKVSYSNIVALRVGGTVKGFNVYPNPFVGDLRIELDAAKAGAVTVRISNAAGQMVYNRSSMVQKGNNVLVIASELSALQRGTYFIELISEDGKQSQKLIKR